MQPINYMSGAQNPMQSYLEGLKFGQDIRATQEALALDEKKKLFQADLISLQEKPTGNGMLNLMMKYPDFAKSLEPIQKAYSSAEKQGELSNLMQVDNALANGNVKLALQLANNTKTALTNVGENTAQIDNIIKLVEGNDVAGAQGITGALLASVLGDKYKTYREGQTEQLTQSSKVIEAGGRANEAVAKGKSAITDMEIKISTKQAEIDRLIAMSDKAVSDAEKADIEAQIAVATKDLRIDEQAYKTSSEKSKAGQEEIKLKYLPKEKELEIQKTGYDIKKVIADIDLTKQSTQLKALEVKLQKETNPLKVKELKANIQKVESEISDKVKQKTFDFTNSITTFNNTVNTVDRILTNPELDSVLGTVYGRIPGTNKTQNDAIADINTLQSQIFLSQVSQLKGTGALSDAEGKKLDASIASLDRTQSTEQFKANVKQIRNLMMKGIRNTSEKYGMQPKLERPNYKPSKQEVDDIVKMYTGRK